MSQITDNQVITILKSILDQGFTDAGQTVKVRQAYQTKQASAGTGQEVYIFKKDGTMAGWPSTRQVFNAGNDDYDTTTTFQDRVGYNFSAVTTLDQLDPAYLSASNLLELTLRIMQTHKTVAALQLSDISMQRVMAVKQGYFTDDRNLFEQSPSFDIVLSYEQTIANIEPKAFPVDLSINRI